MKTIVVAFLCAVFFGLSGVASAQSDVTYDSNTGTIHIRKIAVGSEYYEVNLVQGQGLTWTLGTINNVINPDIVWSDGRMWQQADDGVTRTFRQAEEYCSSLSLAGFSDWRLPLKHELKNLVFCSNGPTPLLDDTWCNLAYRSSVADHPTIDPAFSCQDDRYWTSTIDHVYNGQKVYSIVDFGKGSTHMTNETGYEYVRCVR